MPVQNWKIGIIGGSGFVGSNLAMHFSKNYQVTTLDTNASRSLNGIEFRKCDVRDYNEVKSSVDDLDFLIHCAIIQIPLINEQKKAAYEVNIIGTQNVCRAVDELANLRGMILASSWHIIGERGLSGIIDEEFGFRPAKVEDRARLYVLSKMGQEAITRFYSEMSQKTYGVVRMGTVLGAGMPEKTAANIFIENGLKGEPLTPYKNSMYRPMLYVDIGDVCKSYEIFTKKVLTKEIQKTGNSLDRIVNIYFPEPITILELAEIIRDKIAEYTNREIRPKIQIVDQGLPPLFSEKDKSNMRVDVSKARKLLGIENFLNPRETIGQLIKSKLKLKEAGDPEKG